MLVFKAWLSWPAQLGTISLLCSVADLRSGRGEDLLSEWVRVVQIIEGRESAAGELGPKLGPLKCSVTEDTLAKQNPHPNPGYTSLRPIKPLATPSFFICKVGKVITLQSCFETKNIAPM